MTTTKQLVSFGDEMAAALLRLGNEKRPLGNQDRSILRSYGRQWRDMVEGFEESEHRREIEVLKGRMSGLEADLLRLRSYVDGHLADLRGQP